MVIEIPPRFFEPFCGLVGHFDQDYDGIALNTLIRNLNWYLGKATTYKPKGEKMNFYFSTLNCSFPPLYGKE